MKNFYFLQKILFALIVSLISSAFLIATAQAQPLSMPAVALPVPAGAILPDFANLVEKTGSGVVNIRVTEKIKLTQNFSDGSDEEMQELLRRFFGGVIPRSESDTMPAPERRKSPSPSAREEQIPSGVGSGFIISPEGYIMTNAHVIGNADAVYVTLTDRREFKAKIIGSDTRTDVALLKIEGRALPRLTLGDSGKLKTGEWVIAIGSPFGLENTVTAGIVSAKIRDTGEYLPLIQTDVAVNPGNSGGPLINMRGEVVGINSQIYSRSGMYMGISFAVPINEAMRVIEQLKATGKVTRGRIGVQIGEVTKEVAESLGLSRSQGALVERVESASPAEKSGMEVGDIILKFNGIVIEKSTDLPRLVGNIKPGTKVSSTVWRKGSQRELNLTVTQMEGDKTARKEDKKSAPDNKNALGLVARNLTEGEKKELKINGGVIVEFIQSPAARAGIRAGDIILRLNNTDIKDVQQFNALTSKLPLQKMAVLLVRRGDISKFIPLKPEE